ncbi:cytochrome P450 [Bradyrhizobium diazoefficiens]|uniref:cytochrome P450 n=1 Tax=Bradyrhizobium diazoefficiens TaxID=1355477 RepID=UPI001B8CB6DE|nr:cytochrome P450 [Bradyrhizobium diazoefficiens]MBR0863502.1 cytochrome P450 [Bradyrhizobium diazoefficiens]MBR0888187.1 cytochrome P450 [Bradyrhizobium diazoefficiens]MBR0919828.1 cytochrome P450 [Bradyrhizobium diazoefficiens]
MNINPSTAPSVPIFDVDLYSDEVMADPYPVYAEMRQAGPIVFIPLYGIYFVTRHELVRYAFSAHQDYCSSRGIGPRDISQTQSLRPPSLLLETDPPAHAKYRSVMMRLLSPAALRRLRAKFEAVADELVERIDGKRSFDAFGELTRPFILNAICDAVGLPKEGRDHMLTYGEVVLNLPGPPNWRVDASLAQARSDGTLEWVDRMMRRQSLARDGLAAELFAAADQGEITEDEASMLVRIFLSASVDSTVYTITNGIKNFIDFPSQWEELVAQPTLAREAFEEVLRYNVSVKTLFRTTTRSVELGGVKLPAGAKVGLGFAAANRDPEKFTDPDRFDVRRRPVGHLAFGTGIHTCVGQMVARMEADILFSRLASRFSRINLTGTPIRKINNALSSWSSLPVEVTPKGAS